MGYSPWGHRELDTAPPAEQGQAWGCLRRSRSPSSVPDPANAPECQSEKSIQKSFSEGRVGFTGGQVGTPVQGTGRNGPREDAALWISSLALQKPCSS